MCEALPFKAKQYRQTNCFHSFPCQLMNLNKLSQYFLCKLKNRNGTDAKPYFILAISNIYARTYKLLKVLWTARRSNQLILKEINPEYLLEELMLKLQLQYFSHLVQRANWKRP